MRASELITILEVLKAQHGDMRVFIDTNQALYSIDELDVDTEDTGIIIWAASEPVEVAP